MLDTFLNLQGSQFQTSLMLLGVIDFFNRKIPIIVTKVTLGKTHSAHQKLSSPSSDVVNIHFSFHFTEKVWNLFL